MTAVRNGVAIPELIQPPKATVAGCEARYACVNRGLQREGRGGREGKTQHETAGSISTIGRQGGAEYRFACPLRSSHLCVTTDLLRVLGAKAVNFRQPEQPPPLQSPQQSAPHRAAAARSCHFPSATGNASARSSGTSYDARRQRIQLEALLVDAAVCGVSAHAELGALRLEIFVVGHLDVRIPSLFIPMSAAALTAPFSSASDIWPEPRIASTMGLHFAAYAAASATPSAAPTRDSIGSGRCRYSGARLSRDRVCGR